MRVRVCLVPHCWSLRRDRSKRTAAGVTTYALLLTPQCLTPLTCFQTMCRAFKQRAAAVMDAGALASPQPGSPQQQPFEPVLRRAWRLLRFRTRFPTNAAHVDLEAA